MAERRYCGTCFFADLSDMAKPFCRRYPAQLVTDNKKLQALYPVVNPNTDWCGEHSAYSTISSSEDAVRPCQ